MSPTAAELSLLVVVGLLAADLWLVRWLVARNRRRSPPPAAAEPPREVITVDLARRRP